MKRYMAILLCTVMAIGFVACQPTPEKEIVVHKAAEQLEATLVESEDKEADSTFICPSKLDEEIQMPHFKFVADTDIEIGQAEGFYVYEATQDRFGQTRMDEIVSYFSKDLIGARSGEITKEDLEELIVILKRGMPKKQQDGSVLYEPSADSAEIIESLSEELRNAPNEEYIPIADYDPTFPCNVVFKNSLEQNVYVFADENQIEIFPKNAGTIQLQSWIIKNGGWDGEGPVVLEPVLSKEEALTISKNVLNDLKIEGFEAAHIEAARMLDGFFGYATVSVGYQITFCRAIDGQIPFDSSILTSGVLGFEDEADYIKPWPQERIVLMVDQEGIRFFHWEYPVIITNKLESNMKPLSFEAVWQHAKDLLILGSSWVADATTVEDRHVTRIMLTNCMVRSTKERNKVFLIPTWLFIVQKESALDGHILPSYIAINALDGSRVEMQNNFS